MSYPPNSSPGAQDSSWTTPDRPPGPVVSPSVATHEVAGISPIATAGAADAGGRDTVAGSVAQAMANAEARFGELQADTFGQGSTIGDSYDLPPVVSDMSKHTGSAGSPHAGPAG